MATFENPSASSETQIPLHLSIPTHEGQSFSPNHPNNQKFASLNQQDSRASDKSFSIARNLAEIKEKRKLMESNAQMLLNRLQAISKEEHKLKRNTSDLQKRSQDLLNHRIGREKNKKSEEQEVENREQEKMNEINKVRQSVLEAKAKARLEVEKVRNLVLEKKKQEAGQIRQQRVWHEEKIIQAKLQHIDQQKVKSKKVKESEEYALVKVREFHEVKSELMREEREKLIRQEEERILKKEREIERLNQQEDVMLEHLNKAEDGEAKAVNEYDEISKMPVNELEEKYNYYIKPSHSAVGRFSSGTESAIMSKSLSGRLPLNKSARS